MIMAGNVLTWKQAHDIGYLPRQYDYLPGQLPQGWFEAVLDFKIWALKVLAINGYFTIAATQEKIQLSVFLSPQQTYRVGSGKIDFYRCPTGCEYRLLTTISKTGKPLLADIAQVQ